MDASDAKFQAGLEMRRRVLGEDYVEQAFNAATDFTKPFQELVTRMAWGEVWTRPGLDLATRSLLNLAILTALNRPAELKLHLRGAVRNGVTREQIQEVFLQTAAYCGLPAAMDSFRVAQEFFSQEDSQGQPPLA
jgi:4-carboxymuconolactone decarboxylase